MSESFTEQAENEAAPTERPEGSPALVPFKAVPRRRRADMMRLFADIRSKKDALDAVDADRTPERAAAMYELLAACEDMLLEAADNRDEFAAWVGSCDDAELMALFGWYCSRFQVGE